MGLSKSSRSAASGASDLWKNDDANSIADLFYPSQSFVFDLSSLAAALLLSSSTSPTPPLSAK
jgi:hypothetical protein